MFVPINLSDNENDQDFKNSFLNNKSALKKKIKMDNPRFDYTKASELKSDMKLYLEQEASDKSEYRMYKLDFDFYQSKNEKGLKEFNKHNDQEIDLSLPTSKPSRSQLKKQREKYIGKDWFNMSKKVIDTNTKKDFEMLKLRYALNENYYNNDDNEPNQNSLEESENESIYNLKNKEKYEYYQIGEIQNSNFEPKTHNLNRKQRKLPFHQQMLNEYKDYIDGECSNLNVKVDKRKKRSF